jgi:hypothetical protein
VVEHRLGDPTVEELAHVQVPNIAPLLLGVSFAKTALGFGAGND